MFQCGSSLCAVVNQNKLIRLYNIECSGEQHFGSSDLNNEVDSISFSLLTTIGATKQSSEAIFALSSLGNELVAGSVNVIVHISWKDVTVMASQSENNSERSNYTVDFLTVPK